MEASAFRQELTDPVTLELFVDPVTVPCCGKSFSRQTLLSLVSPKSCPMCNASLEDDFTHFDIETAPKNVLLASLVESLQQQPTATGHHEQQSHVWDCSLTPIRKDCHDVYELVLTCDQSDFKVRPSLFVAVVDESGSMNGRPMDQVRAALNHMVELSNNTSNIILKMISYSSGANEITSVDEYGTNVGGTNFRAAFQEVSSLLRRYKAATGDATDDNVDPQQQSNTVSSVTVAFLTDGQDGSGNPDRLVPELMEGLEHAGWGGAAGDGIDDSSPGPIVVVHTIGFGGSCDRELLEAIRHAGNQEGFFRYADPQEDADALCNKLTDLFEFSTNSSTVPLRIQISGSNEQEIRFAVDGRRHGQYKAFLQVPKDLPEQMQIRPRLRIAINSELDENVSIPVQVKAPSRSVFERWLAKCTDDTAKVVFDVVSGNSSKTLMESGKVRELFCATLELRVNAISRHTDDDNISDRATFLLEQIAAVRAGTQIQTNKLSDLRFASNFSNAKGDRSKNRQTIQIRTLPPRAPIQLDDKPANEYPLRSRYSRNNTDSGRTPLQAAIMETPHDGILNVASLIDESTPEGIMTTDKDGNNALMLAAYCGHSSVVESIVTKHGNMIDLEAENPAGETALTLCIKKRGFHRTLQVLIDAGAKIPRLKALERFCIDRGYRLTAQVLSASGETSLDVDETMTPEYICFMYERAKKAPDEAWDKNTYLAAALGKQMKELAAELLASGAEPTVEMLVGCVPKTPDHPEEAKYLELAKLVLGHHPELIHEKTEPKKETALFAAASRGSRSHVEYFCSLGCDVEAENEKGNTPLWVASFKRYPCIMEFLVEKGANVNHCNTKGNPVIYGPCCRGPPKIAEQLIQAGAVVDNVFETGETTILLCCRNGSSTVLSLLLNYVDDDFVNHKASIDGFNGIMAAAEQDHDECIRVLQNFGIDLDQRTDDDNQILARASPLHIATYYNKTKAVKVLLELGANANAQDLHGSTPMHLAVIQGSMETIRLLRDYADISLRDSGGNTPIAYCRNNPKIQKLLVSPLVDPLVGLAKGAFQAEEEKAALDVLKECGVPGVLMHGEALSVHDINETPVVTHAVIHGRKEVVDQLLSLGISPNTVDSSGVPLLAWAHWTRNARIKKLLEHHGAEENEALAMQKGNLDTEVSKSTVSAGLLFASKPPPYCRDPPSTVTARLALFVNAPCLTLAAGGSPSKDLPKLEASNRRVDRHFDDAEELKDIDPGLIWNAKVHAVKNIMNGTSLDAPELMALGMYTNNGVVSEVLNSQLLQGQFSSVAIKDYAGVLNGALEKLPKYEGESFLAAIDTDRRLFTKGTEFSWKRFASTSTLWRVALENTPSFTSNARKGVVFLIKGSTGRLIGQYSQHPFDSEVIFLPQARFRVTNWYHGDPIALGQANIRQDSYGIEESGQSLRLNMQEMVQSESRLIIELTELRNVDEF